MEFERGDVLANEMVRRKRSRKRIILITQIHRKMLEKLGIKKQKNKQSSR